MSLHFHHCIYLVQTHYFIIVEKHIILGHTVFSAYDQIYFVGTTADDGNSNLCNKGCKQDRWCHQRSVCLLIILTVNCNACLLNAQYFFSVSVLHHNTLQEFAIILSFQFQLVPWLNTECSVLVLSEIVRTTAILHRLCVTHTPENLRPWLNLLHWACDIDIRILLQRMFKSWQQNYVLRTHWQRQLHWSIILPINNNTHS